VPCKASVLEAKPAGVDTDESVQVTPLFPPEYRGSGLLLHVTSLPSDYGVGDLGSSAFAWIDHLHDSGQGWWQSLPLGPTGYCNSPYQAMSSFAGNGLLISPANLISDGLLRAGDCECDFAQDVVDYDSVIPFKHRLLETAWKNFRSGERKDLAPDYELFCNDQSHWLEDYALFRALKDQFKGAAYFEWPIELVQRVPMALSDARRKLATKVDQFRFEQFLLSRQGAALKEYAVAKGVSLIGDLPFFVSPDSSDVWANPELFLLDERGGPRIIAGVPPDHFSAQGQLWGNPVYDWEVHRCTGYRWCIDRLRALLAHVDVIRLDHFRGFAAAWHVPGGAGTAQAGEWVPGPGAEFFETVQRELSSLPFIAEDLGLITPDVYRLRDEFQIPGTRVLQFAFDGHTDNPYLPNNYVSNTVVYTGTHDNPTTREWYEALPEDQRQHLWNYMNSKPGTSDDAPSALMRLAWNSVAALAIVPLQDLLGLGREARMNLPGRAQGNWRWRCTEDMLSLRAFQQLQELTESSKRSIGARSLRTSNPR